MKDIIGALCSGLCIAHCFGVPVLAASGTAFIGVTLLANESSHLLLSAIMLITAAWAFLQAGSSINASFQAYWQPVVCY